VEREVGFVGKERPADLLLKGLKPQPLAVDGTVVAMAFDEPGDRVETASVAKHVKSERQCKEVGVEFCVFGCPPMDILVQKHKS